MGPLWFLRAAEWARHPPSWRKVRFGLMVVALCLLVVGIEHLWGWPAWLTVNGRIGLPRR
ncbi:hypothetical protein GC209_14865 [bacterium]|nr:hypothetical protein [bacterium]